MIKFILLPEPIISDITKIIVDTLLMNIY